MRLGQRAYGRHREAHGLEGHTVSAVQYALKTGRIHADTDGKIDPEVADREWAVNTDAAKCANPDAAPPPVAAPLFTGERVLMPEASRPFGIGDRWPAGLVAPPLPIVAAVNGEGVAAEGFMAWKTKREQFEAQLSELKLGKEAKSLLPTGAVQKSFAQLGRIIAAVRETLPTQLAPALIGKTDPAEIEEILRSAYREADLRISQEIESRILTAIEMEPNAAIAAA